MTAGPAKGGPAGARRRRGAAALVVILSIGVAVFLARGDRDSVALEAIDPADNSTVGAPVDRIRLTLPGTPAPAELHVAVTTASGRRVEAGPPEVRGRTVAVPVRADADGPYTVTYHAELSDRRQVSGTSRFTIGSGTGGMSARAGAAEAPTGGHQHQNSDPLNQFLLVVDVLLISALAGLMLRRPRQQPARHESGAEAP
ncbi:copper resistance CopC family protein [Micromonospora chersina]|uniref:copper resistance CopC family protein n=1 Tax=Micromonospora chersina TaxID=47854 RepID=UPI0033EC26A0